MAEPRETKSTPALRNNAWVKARQARADKQREQGADSRTERKVAWSFRVSQDLRRQIESAAVSAGVSSSEWARRIIVQALANRPAVPLANRFGTCLQCRRSPVHVRPCEYPVESQRYILLCDACQVATGAKEVDEKGRVIR